MGALNQYKSMIWYGLILLGLVVAIVFEAQFFLGKTNTFSQTESELNSRISKLEQRNNALSSLSPSVIAASKQIATVLPAENSVLLVTSQVRTTAVANKVTIKTLTTSSISDQTDPQAGSTQVGLIVEGSSSSVLDFLTSLTTQAPLIELGGVNFVTNPTTTIAQVTLNSYWSPVPTQLPAITESISALTPEETTLLTQLSAFTSPVINSDTPDSSSSAIIVNTAPFSPVN
jgi:hypothetical protein